MKPKKPSKEDIGNPVKKVLRGVRAERAMFRKSMVAYGIAARRAITQGLEYYELKLARIDDGPVILRAKDGVYIRSDADLDHRGYSERKDPIFQLFELVSQFNDVPDVLDKLPERYWWKVEEA